MDEGLVAAMRWRIDLAYDGAGFHGWAAQPGLRTVEGELGLWLSRLLGAPVELTVAGRTDAGVHAIGQVAHFDAEPTPAGRPCSDDVGEALTARLARALPPDMAVHRVCAAPPGFDARFSAIWRQYVYRVWDDDSRRDPRLRGLTATVRGRVDVDAANRAASGLLGLRDFAAFCRRREGASTIRTLMGARAVRTSETCVELEVTADAFCHSMVRSLAGALLEVARGRRDEGWLAGVAASPARSGDVPVMPAAGLTLVEVGYPSDDQLGERANVARSRRS